jgi:hypothetical protein
MIALLRQMQDEQLTWAGPVETIIGAALSESWHLYISY